ncbi:class I SAM-dependent methyltransferase [Chloracidobacterium sp. MS 40/45]|uniref:16S rRNA (guanine(527)-N(7))-methyltransferase RsmG n=1 Tax=Chloracidobacterium aggregatum TaxID=2851959 RepID=UPI001B8D9F2E|nr:RsmG family class I SAM-dependent methyltransferase [Chloracidobacterium aggregatum]QUV99912.1 class I SAM-dependent methyltransferase [Chloracidobacterium sp. MS 40/45]
MADETHTIPEGVSPERPQRLPFVADRDVPLFQAQLTVALANHGIAMDAAPVTALVTHYRLLGEANNRFNLTRLIAPAEAVRWHYLDVLAALPCLTVPDLPDRWVDIGSGGGFPGLVLAVARPDWQFILTERRAKKAAFLRHCVAELDLGRRVQVFAGDIEPGTVVRALGSCGADVSRETFGILARAVEEGPRRLPRLLGIPLFVRAAFWFGQEDARALASRLPPAWELRQHHPLPTGDRRAVILLTRRTN